MKKHPKNYDFWWCDGAQGPWENLWDVISDDGGEEAIERATNAANILTVGADTIQLLGLGEDEEIRND